MRYSTENEENDGIVVMYEEDKNDGVVGFLRGSITSEVLSSSEKAQQEDEFN